MRCGVPVSTNFFTSSDCRLHLTQVAIMKVSTLAAMLLLGTCYVFSAPVEVDDHALIARAAAGDGLSTYLRGRGYNDYDDNKKDHDDQDRDRHEQKDDDDKKMKDHDDRKMKDHDKDRDGDKDDHKKYKDDNDKKKKYY